MKNHVSLFIHFAFFNIYTLTDRPTDKMFTELMLLDERNFQRKKQTFILIATEKIAFYPKPDI